MNKRDVDMQDLIAEESSRGKRHPVRAVDLEQRRQIHRIAQMLINRECGMADYISVIRDDFGLQDGSLMFLRYTKLWNEHRGG
jgi:hypothetical protein